LHGWAWTSGSWVRVWELLEKAWYKVIVPDLPWFGKTELTKVFTLDDYVDVVLDFVKDLWIDEFILWGHSNGGAISIKIVENQNIRSKIKLLVLNNSAWIRNDKKRSLKRKVFLIITKPFRFLAQFEAFKWLRKLFYRAIWNQDYIQAENKPFLKETYLNMISTDLREELKNIKVPILLIWWEKDTYTPLSDWEFMAKNIKNSELVVMKNKKHWIHLKSPEELVEVFLDSIKR
jgi:pimeloyl-ACP methyl ester carboxylesterase